MRAHRANIGQSERMLGQAFRNLGAARKDVVIATKVFGEMGPGPNDKGASRGHILDSVRGSLERLQTDHIDLYQIHGNDAVTPIDETLRALDDLVRAGKVRYLACSNYAAWQLMKALGVSERLGLERLGPRRWRPGSASRGRWLHQATRPTEIWLGRSWPSP